MPLQPLVAQRHQKGTVEFTLYDWRTEPNLGMVQGRPVFSRRLIATDHCRAQKDRDMETEIRVENRMTIDENRATAQPQRRKRAEEKQTKR